LPLLEIYRSKLGDISIPVDVNASILSEYDDKCALYSDFTTKVYELIKGLLKENQLFVHSVSYRIKDRARLEKKLKEKDKNYQTLNDVTDISGIRIITYFSDDVDKVATIVEKEFTVDRENSVDKRALMDPDRFGYLSLHYVVQINSDRLKLTEYKRFSTCKVETQIRSILQHAWAEIEHDLGYKGELAVPREIRRRFSRLAGLLEVADTEFTAIRDSLLKYEGSIAKEIAKSPAEVLINQASLVAYVEISEIVKELDESIASITESNIYKDIQSIAKDVTKLSFVNIETIGELDRLLKENKEIIPKFAKLWIGGSKYKELVKGISLFYLVYVLLGKAKSVENAYTYFSKYRIGSNPRKDSQELIDISAKLISESKAHN